VTIGSLLAVEKNPFVADDIFLTEHGEKQGIFFFIIEGADPFGHVREGAVFQDFHINSVSCMVEKIIPVTKRKDNRKVATAAI
jgi:hypothetical protein